jgi:WD40-like Beta Propeller Repeat
MPKSKIIPGLLMFLLVVAISCKKPTKTREEAIPADAVKMTPATDMYPPVSLSDSWKTPVPMPGPINTAGGEDAPVITLDGKTFFFFWTPDVNIPAEKQVIDGVTGIWWSKRQADTWTEPERIILNDDVSLDGPLCIQDDSLWFCSARVGGYRDIDIYIAKYKNGRWRDWRNVGELLNQNYQIGELYVTEDGNTMIFHRPDFSGYGGYDMWQTERTGDSWTEPVNLGSIVNSDIDEGWPYLSSDGKELWFCRISRSGYAGPSLFRTVKTDSGWSVPVEIIVNFAGDPGLDAEGNIYFTHHFFTQDGKMIEGDIYVAYRKDKIAK